MNRLRLPLCRIGGCNAPAQEIEPGLPALYCAEHRTPVLKQSKMERKG